MMSRYREANPIRRLTRRSAATAPISWLAAPLLHHLDRLVSRLTRGRHTLSSWVSGLPVVMLTTTGAKTGQQRTSPVVGVPDGDNLVVIASNWGQRQHPGWYHNLRAHSTATVTVGGASWPVVAREAAGEERTRLWRQDLQVYPGRAAYERRAAQRHIPVIVLTPASDKPS
jgi:deazaflavin-dependent oxidoreductase (nitroreductase family)